MSALKLTRIGNSKPVGEGENLCAVDRPDGVRLTTPNPEFEQQMEVARKLMKRRRNVLRELTK